MRFRYLLICAALLLPRIGTAAPCAIPYSFVNGTVIDAGQMNSNFNAVAACVGSSSANNASNINSGTLSAQFGGTGNTTPWTPGAVVYATTSSQIGQDPANLFWNASSHSLGIGTGNPGFQLDVVGNGHWSGSLYLEQGASVNFKNNVNAYWNALTLDSGNNVQVGSTNFSGQILFYNNGANRARLDTSGNFFITGFYGVGGSQIACGNLANAAASCSVNATNASNISSGTLPSGRLFGAYSIGNLVVSGTFGGGGNIGLDNGENLLLKDNGGNYRIGIQLDGNNNLHLGDNGGTNAICFFTNGSSCGTFINSGGVVNTNTSYIFTHGQLTYNSGSPNYAVFQNPSVTGGAYIALEDNGVVFIQAASGNYSCQMSSTFSPNWGCSSDAELKNWQPLAMVRVVPGAKAADTAIAAILRLRPVSFSWKGDAENRLHMGFLAQDVEQVFPELVGTNSQDGTKLMATDGLIAPLVLALQELVAEVRGAKNARKK